MTPTSDERSASEREVPPAGEPGAPSGEAGVAGAPPGEPGAGGAPALALRGVTKRFGSLLANDDVSLTVASGEIHALLGENGAGKTTLMNIVFGLLSADSGEVSLGGRPAAIKGPRDAIALGIGMVHQHFKLVPDMSVAENLALASGATGLGRLRLDDIRQRARSLSERFGLDVHADRSVETLSVGEQQRVEILKLLHRGAHVLILDEPTAVLTPAEWRQLAEVLRSLAADGHAIVFITHKLDEVFEIASRCTVLRDGRVVGTGSTAETSKEELARLMVGREVALRVQREVLAPGPPVLEVEGLRAEEEGRELLCGLSFTVRAGEVFAVAGVEGNGQTELVEVLSGTRQPSAGRIELERGAYGVVPEDRQRTALALDLPVADNLMMKDFGRAPFARRGLLSHRRARARCERLLGEFDIRAPGIGTPTRALSGGNQQKVVLARELDGDRRLLIAAQPTRGLDVGAMEFVYARLAEFKRGGGGILLISSELDEILSIADRIAVMVSGTFVDVVDADAVDPEALGLMMGGRRREVAAGSAA